MAVPRWPEKKSSMSSPWTAMIDKPKRNVSSAA
jgi:hypothetical protein